MHSYEGVMTQLANLGIRPGRIFRGEVIALSQLLLPEEVIEHYMTGRYEAGPAIMVATNRRLILVDKKPFNLTVEDIPYDMISEVEYTMMALSSYISVHSLSKKVSIMSFRQNMLREFAIFVQARVMEIRASGQYQQRPSPAQQMAGMRTPTYSHRPTHPSTPAQLPQPPQQPTNGNQTHQQYPQNYYYQQQQQN